LGIIILIKPEYYSPVSKFTIFLGLIIICFTTLVFGLKLYEKGFGYDYTVFSIPFSLGIAIFSVGLAFDSTSKMIDISNVNFLQISSDFEEARMMYIHPVPQFRYSLEAFLWRSKHHIEQTNQFDKKIIFKNNQEKIYSYFYVTMRELFDENNVQWNNIRPDDRNRIIEMYSVIRKYDYKIGNFNGLIGIFERHMQKFPFESEQNFFRNLVFRFYHGAERNKILSEIYN
jgi:hypothetical protein